MSKGADVLERSVIQQGKVFIKAGEENCRAYIIQNGGVCAYAMKEDQKIVVSTYGPGTIIGEACLVLNSPLSLNYEALETTTVVTVTRQDFQKRLARTDKTVRTILDHALKKIEDYEKRSMTKAVNEAEPDTGALKLIDGLFGGLSEDKKIAYQNALLPHINGLIKELRNIKKSG